MPLLDEENDQGGYSQVVKHGVMSLLSDTDPVDGGLAVLYDKNPMEATGYAE